MAKKTKVEWEKFGSVTSHVFQRPQLPSGTLACLQSSGQPGRDHVNIKLKDDGRVEIIFWFSEAVLDDNNENSFIQRHGEEKTVVIRSPEFAERVRKSDAILKRYYDWLNDPKRKPLVDKPPKGPIKKKGKSR